MAKSLKNLVEKKLLGRESKFKLSVAYYYLTEQGFLKANECLGAETTVSYKDYQKIVEKRLTDRNAMKERFAERMRKEFLTKRRPSERMEKWYAPFFNTKS